MFESVAQDIFRWGTIDPESGIMMCAHLLLKDRRALLIDPIALPNLIPLVKVLGEPEAIIMTNYPHIRGPPLLSRQYKIPLFFPNIKEADEDEALTNMFLDLYNARHGQHYGASTELPMGIRAHIIPGRHEFALSFGDYLIVGDSAYGVSGKLHFYPSGIWPDETGDKAHATKDALVPVIKRTGANGLLSGHNEDIASGLQDMV